jgi:hypothetical protein
VKNSDIVVQNLALIERQLLREEGVDREDQKRIPFKDVLWSEQQYVQVRDTLRRFLDDRIRDYHRKQVDVPIWCSTSLNAPPACTLMDYQLAIQTWGHVTVAVFRCMAPPWAWLATGLQNATRVTAEDACLNTLMDRHIRPYLTETMSTIEHGRVRSGPLRMDPQCYIWVSGEASSGYRLQVHVHLTLHLTGCRWNTRDGAQQRMDLLDRQVNAARGQLVCAISRETIFAFNNQLLANSWDTRLILTTKTTALMRQV